MEGCGEALPPRTPPFPARSNGIVVLRRGFWRRRARGTTGSSRAHGSPPFPAGRRPRHSCDGST